MYREPTYRVRYIICIVPQVGTYVTYNFYDFTEQHFAASFYDASSCYTPDERKSFVIIFKDRMLLTHLLLFKKHLYNFCNICKF